MAIRLPRSYRRLIRIASHRWHVGPHVLAGLIEVEDPALDPYARSPAGARGLTQFMPSTGRSYHVRIGRSHGAVASQILGAAHYLHDLGYSANRRLALAKYNAGPGNPSAGMGYANTVMHNARAYYHRGLFGGGGGRGRGGRGGGASVTRPSLDAGTVTPGGTGVVSLLREMRDAQQPALPQASVGVAAPNFSAQATLPAGYQSVQTGPPPAKDDTFDRMLEAVSKLRGASIPHAKVTGGSITGGGGGSAFHATARSRDAGNSLGRMLRIADAWDKAAVHYQWGGGHGSRPAKPGTPVDCSGYVSAILGVTPRVSGAFERWGQAGKGRHVTVYANGGHVLVAIRVHGHTRWYATSHENPGGGAGRRSAPSRAYLSSFVARHPRGL